MKTCFSTFACPDWNLKQILAAAVNHNYDGVEFRCDAGHTHAVELWASDKERAKVKELVARSRLEIPVLATGLTMASDGVIEKAERRIELAHAVGAKAIRVFCGNPELAISEYEVFELVVENLRRIAELGEFCQMKILLETNDRMTTAARVAEAVHKTEHQNVGAVWNNLHTYRKGESVAESMKALQGILWHIHFHDGMNLPNESAIKPMHEGEMPIKETFTALLESKYDGYISGEWFYDQYGPDPDEAIQQYSLELSALGYENDMLII